MKFIFWNFYVPEIYISNDRFLAMRVIGNNIPLLILIFWNITTRFGFLFVLLSRRFGQIFSSGKLRRRARHTDTGRAARAGRFLLTPRYYYTVQYYE